ncbi:MAG: amidohydrolase [Planctomycetes bacterium]|nr:amidohydrolase [Planctomycetota bacterium]
MSMELRRRLFDELDRIELIDSHSHINPHQPASRNLADILGYHYYTELAHSAGVPKDRIEEPGLDAREKVRRLFACLGRLTNTIQYSWFLEMVCVLLGYSEPDRVLDDFEGIWELSERRMASPDWENEVLARSGLRSVFLTNDFDDPLDGFNTSRYVPCLRTDELVFHLARRGVRTRLEEATRREITDLAGLREALGTLFMHFTAKQARACAISLPPDFAPARVSEGRAETALADLLRHDESAPATQRRAVSNWVFWTLAEYCAEFHVPFDLMIGVNRRVYEGGVFQGQDLYDSRVSLIQYAGLFNAFPQVTFPVSVLASVTNQELASYAWIFPNVVTHGHWWYSNTPTYIEHDASARLEGVPRSKQIAYYSDMYKLEFALPKFRMYKRILGKILAERFVIDRGWSEEQAVDLGHHVLRGNVDRIFGFGSEPA